MAEALLWNLHLDRPSFLSSPECPVICIIREGTLVIITVDFVLMLQ